MFSEVHGVREGGRQNLQIQGTVARKSQVLCLLVALKSLLEDLGLCFVGKQLKKMGV